MRRLMWFTIGFGAACALCAYCYLEAWTVPLSVFLLAAGIGVGIGGREWKTPRRIAYACIGCAVGLLWFLTFRQYYLLPAIALDGERAQATVTATDYSFDTAYGTAVDASVELEGKRYQVRVYINEKQSIEPGDQLRGEFRFRVTTSGGAEEATYHQGKGIFLLGYQSDTVELIQAANREAGWYPALLAEKIKSIIQAAFPEDTFPFAHALLLGDDTALDYETETAFKLSGIRHIIAVSGLHVSILYGLISVLTMKRRYLTALLGIPVLFLFAAVAGFTPSVTRACLMVCLMMAASAFNREYDSATALAFACVVMLAANPLTITSVSFQLSVASVAGIYLFYSRILAWMESALHAGRERTVLNRLKRWLAASVSVSISSMSLTTPLCAWYFGTVSLVGFVTNLLTLWAVSFIFYGIIGVCVLYFLSVPLAGLLAEGVSWLIRYILVLSRWLAGLPLAAVYTRSVYIEVWLVFVYILLAVFLFTPKRRPRVLICCGVIGLCIALCASWMEPLVDECRVTVLNVGQGQSILLQSQGKTYLVDCGGDSDTGTADIVAETLLSQGIRDLDGLILTHYDADHAGGAQYLLTRMDTKLLFLPDTADEGLGDTLASATGGEVVWVSDDLELTFGDAKLTVFGPIYSAYSNENSLCVLFETQNCAILITGDRSAFGERLLLRDAALPDVDILVAGHHGSKSSTSEELLKAVRPETVIISVGENSYGHPSSEVLERLDQFGCTVYRTDESGTIIYRR